MSLGNGQKAEIIRNPKGLTITETVQDNLLIRTCKYPNGVTLQFVDSADGSPLNNTTESTMSVRFSRGRTQEKQDSLHYYEHQKIQQLINNFPNIGNNEIDCNGTTATNNLTFRVSTRQRSNIPTFIGILESLATPLSQIDVTNEGQHAYINSEMQTRKARIRSRLREALVTETLAPTSPALKSTVMMQQLPNLAHADISTEQVNAVQNRILSSAVTITVTNVGPIIRERIEQLAASVSSNRKSVLVDKLPPPKDRVLTSEARDVALPIGESENIAIISFLIPLRELQGRTQREDALFNLFLTQTTGGPNAMQRKVSFTPPGIYWGHAYRDEELNAFDIGAEVPFKDALKVTQLLSDQIFLPEKHVEYIRQFGWENIQKQLIASEKEQFLKDPTRVLFWSDIFGKVVTFPMLERMITEFTAEEYLEVISKLKTASKATTLVISSANEKVNAIRDQMHELRESGELL